MLLIKDSRFRGYAKLNDAELVGVKNFSVVVKDDEIRLAYWLAHQYAYEVDGEGYFVSPFSDAPMNVSVSLNVYDGKAMKPFVHKVAMKATGIIVFPLVIRLADSCSTTQEEPKFDESDFNEALKKGDGVVFNVSLPVAFRRDEIILSDGSEVAVPRFRLLSKSELDELSERTGLTFHLDWLSDMLVSRLMNKANGQ